MTEFPITTDHFRVENILHSHIAHHYNEREWQKLQAAPVLYYIFEYTDYNGPIDLLEQLPEDLRNEFITNPKYKLVIDYRTEGAPFERRDFYNMLYYTRDKYNLPSKKFAFWTSNLNEDVAYKKWSLIYDRYYEPDPIRYVIWNFWQCDARRYTAPEHTSKPFAYKKLDSNKKVTTSFLCMNRRPHIHRRLLQAELFRTGHHKQMLISADEFDKYREQELSRDWPVDPRVAASMNLSLPWLLDTDTLEFNLVNTAPLGLYQQSAASIVTESENMNWRGSCLFYSEKTYKAMLFGHPILILGQQYANHNLKEQGFELFEDYFDYTFDTLGPLWDRVTECAREIRRCIDNNSVIKMKTDPSVRERIKHNRSIILKDEFNRKPSRDFLRWIEQG